MKRAALLFSTLLFTVVICLAIVGSGSGPYADSASAPLEIANPVATDTDSTDAGPTIVARNLFFVELKSPPLAEATPLDTNAYLATLKREKDAFRAVAAATGLPYEERYAYDTLWNGLSVKIDPGSVSALVRMPGVGAIYPVGVESVPGPAFPRSLSDVSPDLFSAITMTGADQVQATGILGAGVRVAVIDTGIDYNHPDLGGGFGPGHRVEAGFDFVGDDYTGSGSTPKPDPDPMDCAGHGTHVSGIIGANGGVKGVAPGVIFHAYRVFGCAGRTTDDVILKAMEAVFNDGSQILNMSLGSAYGWPQTPLSRAGNTLVNHGIVVVASAGNAGDTGLYSAGQPAVGQKVIAVGSVDNIRVVSPAFTLAGGALIGYQPMDGAQNPPTTGTYDIASVGRACNSAPPSPAAVAGKVALIQRGTCSFREKALNAMNAGATAALVYNSAPGIFLGTVGRPALAFPVASLSREDGLAIIAQLPTTLTWTDRIADPVNSTGRLTSSFSAYGVAPDLTLKPDLTAPGGLIFSTLPLAQGGYGLLSGTSMSSPHVAGAVALLLEAHPHTSSQAVRDILQNSASPILWWGNPGLGFLDNTHRQGAGLLDILASIHATSHVTPGKLSLGETEGGPVMATLTVENDGASPVTYTLSHQPALATGPNTFSVGFFGDSATASFSSGTLPVGPGGTASVDVTVTEPPGLPNRSLFGGYIVFTPDDGGAALRVPYSAFKGNYQSILVLNPAASMFGNPLLRKTNDLGPSGPITIDPAKGERALVVIHLDHQVRRLRIDIAAAAGRSFSRLGEIDYVERDSTPTEFFTLGWDGITGKGVPLRNGTYVLKLSIEKALGQDANPADWETWTSPVITIARTMAHATTTGTRSGTTTGRPGGGTGSNRIVN